MYMIFCNGFEPWIQDFYSRSKIRPFFNYHSSTCICAWTNSHFWTASSGTIVSVYSDFLEVSLHPIDLTSKLLSKQIIKDLDVHLPTMISLNSSEAFTMYLCVMIQTGTVYTCWNIILYNVCPFNRWLSYNTAVISSHDHHTWSNAHGHQLLEEELAGVWNTDLGDLQ